jgi:hypothetical protein
MGVALGMAWTFVVGIAYRQRAMRPFNGMAASLIFYGMLASTFTWQVAQNLESDIAALKLPLPQNEISAQGWWEDEWQVLPRERSRSPSVAARNFNFQFAGEPEILARILSVHGWQEASPANWRWALMSMNPEPTELTLPPLKRDYLGYADILLLHRLGGDPYEQETIRIWDSGFSLVPGGQTVYLGQVDVEVLVQRMKFFSYWRARPPGKDTLERFNKEAKGLQVKQVDDEMLLIREPQVSMDF